MKKDYTRWHPLKTRLHNTEDQRPFFHEREIWSCHFGENIGFEQDGRGGDFLRPVIVFRKFNKEIFWGIPLTRTDKKSKFYFTFPFDISGPSTAILSQIRLIDAKRLSHEVGQISRPDFDELKKRFTALLP